MKSTTSLKGENIGKESYKITEFLQNMIDSGKLTAYSMGQNFLIQRDHIEANDNVILKNGESKNLYDVCLSQKESPADGLFFDSGSHLSEVEIRKLKEFDPAKLGDRPLDFKGRVNIPYNNEGRIILYFQKYIGKEEYGKLGNLELNNIGEDHLLRKLSEFLID